VNLKLVSKFRHLIPRRWIEL